MKLKKKLFMMLIAVVATLGITTVNAATISDDGKYALLLSSKELDPTIDGEYVKLIRFNVEDGTTIVKLSELVKGIMPFNGKNEFSHWENDNNEKVLEELKLSDFTKEGNFFTSTGEEIKYTNGLNLNAQFKGAPLKETGNYYVTLDAFAGIVNNKAKLLIQSKKEEFQIIDLTKYIPDRKGYTFKGWDLDGKFVTSIDASAFKNEVLINLIATYTKDTFDNDGIVLTLNSNGGTIDGRESNKYDYLGGGDSGTSMSLLPYIPVREGYTFNGWNTKKDGSGENYKYVYWRFWDIDEQTDKEFDKDTKIKEENGYERYKNITLYATWIKNNEIKSDGDINVSITFDKKFDNEYVLDIKKVEIKKELSDKNVKYLVDINILENGEVVKINDTKMKIKIALPEELKGYKKYEVVYILNNEIKETIPATIEDGYIVFETTHLSEYGIVATEKIKDIENPKTGDNIGVYLVTSLIALIGLLTIYRKKQIN